jgi:hypothetical protein
MCIVAESNVMLRAQAEFPDGFKVASEMFLEGWTRMRSGGVVRLEKKVRVRGWNFLKIAEGAVKSGVGATSEEAIASALKLALRRVDAHSNAVEVERIQLTIYPWFCLARVRVLPYRIQEGGALAGPANVQPLPLAVCARQPLRQADELLPEFAAAIPILREMLIASGNAEVRAQ